MIMKRLIVCLCLSMLVAVGVQAQDNVLNPVSKQGECLTEGKDADGNEITITNTMTLRLTASVGGVDVLPVPGVGLVVCKGDAIQFSIGDTCPPCDTEFELQGASENQGEETEDIERSTNAGSALSVPLVYATEVGEINMTVEAPEADIVIEMTIRVIDAAFIDDFPDYATDVNNDSDNFFLREMKLNGDPDSKDLDIWYRIDTDGLEVSNVKIKIFEEETTERG